MTIQLTFTGQGTAQFETAMEQLTQFFTHNLDKARISLWSCTMPNSDLELWMAGQPIQVSFSDGAGFERTETVEQRTFNIENYVVTEYDKQVVREVNKSEEQPQSGLRKRDLFNKMKELAFTSPGPNEYHHAVNRLIAQTEQPTSPHPQEIAQRRQHGQQKPGNIFKKWENQT